MHKLDVLIAGSTGYIGIQLVKLLLKHPNINIKYLCGNSSIGKNISKYDSTIKKKLPLISKFEKSKLKDCDIIFTALPSGEAQEISKFLLKKNTLIDLSGDFRLKDSKSYSKWYKQKHKAIHKIKKSIYLLPELNNININKYQIISCPGCYPTSILLALIPLIKNKMIKLDNIIIDSKSGYSGAGRSVYKKNSNKNLNESLSAYGVGFHKHNSEIEQEMKNFIKGEFKVIFTPHLTPMFRGILSTIYVDLKKNVNHNKIITLLKKFYKNKNFIKVMKKNHLLSTNDVINTNNCHISVCKTKYKNKLIILSVIDNLIKGGSGQAIQNMNQKFKFKETEGLL